MSQLCRTISYKGVMLEVEYDYSPPYPGDREPGTGLLMSPPEHAEAEITKLDLVYEGEGCVLMVDLGDLIDDQHEAIQEQLLEEMSNDEPEERH